MFNFEFRIGELEFAFERLTFVSSASLRSSARGSTLRHSPAQLRVRVRVRALELKFNVEFRIGELEFVLER